MRRPDFQAVAPNDVLAKIKYHDTQALLLLMRYFAPEHFQVPYLEVMDLGCGEGKMLIFLLVLASKLKIHLLDTDRNRCESYAARVRDQHQNIEIGEVLVEDMGRADFKSCKADLILASHSLYYCGALWKSPIDFEKSLLTKLISLLNPSGIICVLLQSSKLSGQFGKGGMIATVDELENLVYPIISRLSARPVQDRKEYATAEDFEASITDYSAQAAEKWKITWIASDPIVFSVNLGEVKFDIDQLTRKYSQVTHTTSLFNFYTRGLYDEFSLKDQATLLNFIRHRCQTDDNQYLIMHVNRAFIVKFADTHAPAQQPASVPRLGKL